MRQNIFGSQKVANKYQEETLIPQNQRMPFELACTFISSDSQNNDPQAKAPQNSLAQKMNHMNDLTRKSLTQHDCSTITGRSIEAHHKPSKEPRDTKAH
jgi:hypothetical protein